MNLSHLFHALRKNSLIFFATAGLILSLSLIVYYADQTFIDAKNKYIISSKERYFPEIYRLNLMMNSSAGALFSSDSARALEAFSQQFKTITDNPHSIIYRIELREKNKRTLVDIRNGSKIKSMNRRDNCLFSRNFSRFTNISFEVTPQSKIELVNYYTSPVNDPVIGDMVSSYRWKVYPLMALLFLLYITSLRVFILPVRRVIDKLEGIKEREFSPIGKPRTLLESAYNKMSRNASILNINLRMNDAVASQPDLAGDSLIKILLPLAQEAYPGLELFKTRYIPEENRLEITFGAADSNAFDCKDSQLMTCFMQHDVITPFEVALSEKKGYAIFIESFNHEGWYLFLAKANEGLEEMEAGLKSLSQQMRLAVRSRELQRRFIEQEKSQVSIHLARSLGHDVTNILASIRWDLDTLDTLLQGQAVSADDKNHEVFAESMEGLSHGTELLQEIIEVYRSFMYLEKPFFEEVDVKPVMERLMELFQRSTTHHIDLRLKMDTSCQVVMDPRLFKLAFFNLLTNALEAIKKQGIRNASLEGLIEVSVSVDKDKNTLIKMADNGTGIRNLDGSLMADADIHRIFQYGFTTKLKSGGLGLAWVYTIICDVHHGKLAAYNRPEGGSGFVITLPPLVPNAGKSSVS
jgi:signal transduction histidine kinase